MTTVDDLGLMVARFESPISRDAMLSHDPSVAQRAIPIMAMRYGGHDWASLDRFVSQYDLRRFNVVDALEASGAKVKADENCSLWFKFERDKR